jgi:secretion/DNA translocation related CpaE-like protein
MSADVLLITADPTLAAAVPRLCALAGVGCEVQSDSDAIRGAWRGASVVLVGCDVASALAAAALPRRDRVMLLTTEVVGDGCWQAALALGATSLLRLPDQQAALVDELSRGPAPAAGAARVLGVLGGCGGAGASTLAAALADTAGRSSRTLLIDGDPLGGGLDVLVGVESAPGVRWHELAATRGRLDPKAFTSAICEVHGFGLLSWGRDRPPGGIAIEAIDAVLAAASRAFATVIIDIARCPSRASQRLLEASEAVVVVVPADVRAVAATAALVGSLSPQLTSPYVVVRDPGRLAAKDVAASLRLPLAATVRSEASVQSAAHRGESPVRRGRCSLTQACEEVLSAAFGSARS